VLAVRYFLVNTKTTLKHPLISEVYASNSTHDIRELKLGRRGIQRTTTHCSFLANSFKRDT